MKRALLPLLAALALAACGRADNGEVSKEVAAAAPARAGQPAPRLAYTYDYGFRLPGDVLAEAQRRHIAMCDRLGLARCRVLETHGGAYGANASGSTTLEVASGIAQAFGDALVPPVAALGGTLVSSDVAAEDLSRQIVDSEARVRAKQLLVTRLTRMLATRNGTTADLVATEKAVAGVQEELDAARTTLAQARGRIATSPVHIAYTGTPTLSAQVGAAFGAVGETFSSSVAALIYFLAAVVPWAIAMTLLFLAGRRLLRRVRRPKA